MKGTYWHGLHIERWSQCCILRCTPLLYLLTEVCVLLLQGLLLGVYKQGPCGRSSIHVDLVWSNFWLWNYLDICGYKHLQQYHNRCKTSWLHTQLLIQVESKSFSNSHVLLCPCREHSIPFTTSGFRHWAHTLVMSPFTLLLLVMYFIPRSSSKWRALLVPPMCVFYPCREHSIQNPL